MSRHLKRSVPAAVLAAQSDRYKLQSPGVGPRAGHDAVLEAGTLVIVQYSLNNRPAYNLSSVLPRDEGVTTSNARIQAAATVKVLAALFGKRSATRAGQ